MLSTLGIQTRITFQEPLPQQGSLLVVSNHRSFLDAPLLMATLDRSIRFACHHYMSQVPGLREFVTALGCFPMDSPGQRQRTFFDRASQLLRSHEVVGIFPEGTRSMINIPSPGECKPFYRGFAHLALRAPVDDLTVVPMAIAASHESQGPIAPLQLFQWFDPTEPLFQQSGWHPAVIYHQVEVRVGKPIPITPDLRDRYQGKQARQVTQTLTQACSEEVQRLLQISDGVA